MSETSSNPLPNQKPPRLNQMIHKSWQGLLLFLEIIGLRRVEEEIDQAAQVARLKLNHAEFRKLLSANNSFLETITELEHKDLNQEFVDLPYIKRKALRAIADIHTMVETLIVISHDRYTVLREVLEGIAKDLTRIFEESDKAEPLEGVMDLSKIVRSHGDLAGGKVANLGEIGNILGLPIPEGFVVTTEGFRLLIEEGGLRSWIQDKDMELLSTQDVEKVSQSLREQILKIQVPSSLQEAIHKAYDRLTARIGVKVPLAVRSSALGEDSGFSFAGQFLSLLNIGPEGLIEAYLQIVASLYSPEAIHYRLLHGIPGQSAEMAVGFISMVDAYASGVTFSKDPSHPESGLILIQTIRGLGVPLVEGRTSPELISISRDLNPDSIVRISSEQKTRLVLSSESGLKEEEVSREESQESCLTDEEVIRFGQWALLLEDHFGTPQDIEWAINPGGKTILLQSRPLRLIGHTGQTGQPLPGYELLIHGGEVACPGTASGPAIHMTENDDLNAFPDGGILIARRSSPRFVRLMSKARAIVTDFGSTTGHMASLAREFRVPALLNTKTATQKIPPGTIITVDAASGLVYQGEVPLIREEKNSADLSADIEGPRPATPDSKVLLKVMQLIHPLNLTDPQANTFKADQCQTLHDLARYIHEKSYQEMFMMGERVGDLRASSYHLDIFLPIDLYLIDLGGGLKGSPKQNKVKRNQITSVPLAALLEGMLHEKIPRYGAKSMDFSGFFSIMMRHATTNPEGEKSFHDPCYAMISDNYLNYTARVGYHFSVVDTYCSLTPNKNYISLTFRGGAADFTRRSRRTRAIAGILKEYGFHVGLAHDVVSARLGKAPRDEMVDHIKMIGSLFQFFRQMDAAMVSEDSVDQFKEAFLRGDYDFGQTA
ncbi:MAG: phosphoenolpyruvate synthase [Desulfobacca sp.]|nr:phosphoenolpyruvate synthase [Desulfobacca sp.]